MWSRSYSLPICLHVMDREALPLCSKYSMSAQLSMVSIAQYDLRPNFVFYFLSIFGRTLWMGDRPVAKRLPASKRRGYMIRFYMS